MAYERFEFQGTSITIDTDYTIGDRNYEFRAERRNGKPAAERLTIHFCPEQGKCIDDIVDLFDAAALPVEMEYLLLQEGARLNDALRTEVMKRKDPDY